MPPTSITIHDVYPDKSFYHPAELARLVVELSAKSTHVVQIELAVMHLATQLGKLCKTVTLQAGEHTAITFEWMPVQQAPRGYGVDICVKDPNGGLLARCSTAFDVLERWTQMPRYGFLTDFTPGREDAQETVAVLSRYHINGLQFYDWMYRHAEMLPPAGTVEFTDPLGRWLSMRTTRAFLDAAHRCNMVAMPYTTIYGASLEFAEMHPEWALSHISGETITFAGFLTLMNPASDSPWARHLLDQFEQVLRQSSFDGLHIDQYGEEHTGMISLDATGTAVNLPGAFAAMISAAKARAIAVDPKRSTVLFNCVGNWPIEAIASSEVDFPYIELWPPDITYVALHRVIAQAAELSGGKPVILAAYMSPRHEVNIMLMKAIIFASGGTQIELGERDGMLADAYFPKYERISPTLQRALRRYYDFAVRYENVLMLGTQPCRSRVAISGLQTSDDFSPESIAVLGRRGADLETINLINLCGIADPKWTAPQANPPRIHTNLRLRAYTRQPVSHVWLASPDAMTEMQPLAFTHGADENEECIEFTVPSLCYWDLIVLESITGNS